VRSSKKRRPVRVLITPPFAASDLGWPKRRAAAEAVRQSTTTAREPMQQPPRIGCPAGDDFERGDRVLLGD